MLGVIPRLYNGLYATPGPLLAAPPVLLGRSWRTARARGETEPRRRAEGDREEARRPGGDQEEGPHHPNPQILLCGFAFSIPLYSILFYSI